MTAAERAKLPTAIGGMVPPIHLSDLAQLLFNEIAGLLHAEGRAEPRFAQHVALLAIRLEQIQRFQAVLETAGDTCTSRSVRKVDGETVIAEMIRARPEVAMLSDAMRQAQSLLGELMLNPSAALRIASGKQDAAGEFDDF
ncbi:P27 family phage terminase small subunit [Sphingomonas sp. ABOLF]|uniref:P27 family phage terminase small subunit n=1 Tax=Sphingomonas sp. ABOLF TaxID=1985879 RepID=UPI001F49A0FC|nr:P27 family phage terminase small subunit [Sphingomonas sp. ABOLF]